MRVGGLALVAVVGCGAAQPPPKADVREPVPDSLVGYRGVQQGCLVGDCKAGRFGRRTGDRVISGVIGARFPSVIEWERGPCAGSSYAGAIAADVPDGTGTLTPDHGPYRQITAQFVRGQMVAVASADIALPDGAPATLHGELRIVPATCSIRVSSPGSVVVTSDSAVSFRGVVRIDKGRIALWRGTIDGAAGYVGKDASGRWSISAPAVCLRGDCVTGDGIEHVGGGPAWELYDGRFADGLRTGGTIHVLTGVHVYEYRLEYSAGMPNPDIALIRPHYTVHGKSVGGPGFGIGLVGTGLWETVQVDGVAGSLEVRWRDDGAAVQPDTVTDAARGAVPGFAATVGPVLAAVASMQPDLARRDSRYSNGYVREYGRVPQIRAVTDGPRTLAIISETTTRLGDARSTDVEAVKHILQAWLPDRRELLIGRTLAADDPNDNADIFTGDAILRRRDGSSTPVLYYAGVRIDPLGYRTVAAYEKATPADRASRARHAAHLAASLRDRDERLTLALRRLTAGAGSELSLLATASSSIAATATDTMGYERVIRSAHVAVEQASDAVIDALIGADAALERMDSGDPAFDAVAALGAQLRDHDDRLRVLLLAFEAFDYSDDLPRLEAITQAFAADLAAVPAASVDHSLAQLRKTLAGAPQPTPEPAKAADRQPAPEPEPDDDADPD